MASLWADYTFHERAERSDGWGRGALYRLDGELLQNDTDTGKKNDSFNVAGYALMDATVKYDLARFGLPDRLWGST